MLKALKQAPVAWPSAVDNGEGCAIEALINASIFIAGAGNALDRLIDRNFVRRRCGSDRNLLGIGDGLGLDWHI